MAKLSKEEIVTIDVLKEKGETNQAIAERLGVTEGAVRFIFAGARLRRPMGERSRRCSTHSV